MKVKKSFCSSKSLKILLTRKILRYRKFTEMLQLLCSILREGTHINQNVSHTIFGVQHRLKHCISALLHTHVVQELRTAVCPG